MDIDAAKIFFVQLADAPLMQLDLLSWSRHYRNLPGQGDLPVTDFVAALDAIGYTGPLSLEIFNDRFRAGSANMIAREGIRAMHVLRDDAAVRNGYAPSLPVRTKADRIEFFEFAASGD